MDICYDYRKDHSRKILCVKMILIFPLVVMMYVPVYLKLADKPYDFRLDVGKLGVNHPTAIFWVYIGTIGWGVWCAAFGVLGLALICSIPFCIYKRCRQ